MALPQTAAGADYYWDGGGADALWQTAGNWEGDGVPATGSGHALYFGGSTRLSPTNDFSPGTEFGKVVFEADAGSFTLSGNSLSLAGDGSASNTAIASFSANPQTIQNSISIAGPVALRTEGGSSQGIFIAGAISGTGGLEKQVYASGQALVELSGENTYTGATRISAGILQVTTLRDAGFASSLGAPTGSDATITFGTGVRPELRLNGGESSSTDRPIDLQGTTSVISQVAPGAVEFSGQVSSSVSGSRTLELAGSGTGVVEISGAISNGAADGFSIKKEGTSKWILSGSNSYTGTTTVNNGILVINGDQSGATGGLTVAPDGRLEGTGVIGGSATIQGTHAPGNSPGVQTFENGVTYASGSIFEWELTSSTTSGRGTAWDAVDLTGSGTLTTDSEALFRLILDGGVDFSGAFWSETQVWDVFAATSGAGITSVFQNFEVTGGVNYSPSLGSFSMDGGGNLVWSPVPEPSSAFVGILLSAGLLRRKRNSTPSSAWSRSLSKNSSS